MVFISSCFCYRCIATFSTIQVHVNILQNKGKTKIDKYYSTKGNKKRSYSKCHISDTTYDAISHCMRSSSDILTSSAVSIWQHDVRTRAKPNMRTRPLSLASVLACLRPSCMYTRHIRFADYQALTEMPRRDSSSRCIANFGR